MKKVIFIAFALAVGMTGFAQRANQAYKSIIETCPKPSPVRVKDGSQTPGFQFNMSGHRAIPTQRDTELDESLIMTTNYDLQSNSALGNRIATWVDGTASFVATWDHSGNTSFPDRGTGYNYYDGSSFGDMLDTRIEPVKSGWPSIAACGDGEILASHASGTNVYYRPTKGQGEWILVQNFPNVTWPRIICSGSNDQYVHLVTVYQESVDGVYMNHIYYARSTDSGQTWSDLVEFPNLDNSEYGDYRNQLSSDDYVIAANGNNVAVLFGGYTTEVFYMISYDNGLTWERQVVAPFPVAGVHAIAFSDYPYGMDYPINTSDNSLSIVIDDNGVVHVAFGLFHWQVADSNTYNYWQAYGYGIVYWNSEYVNEHGGHEIPLFGNFSGDANHYDWAEEGGGLGYSLFPDRITELAEADGHQHLHLFGYIDEDGDGYTNYSFDIYNRTWSYRTFGLATMPGISIDEQGNIAIIYNVLSESRINVNTNYPYRSAFVTCRDAYGTWFDDAINLSGDFVHENDEVYSTFAAPKGYNGSFWVGYFADESQGLYMDINDTYPNSNGGVLTENYLYAVRITPDMAGWGNLKYQISATANPTEYGYVNGSGWYVPGSNCTLRAVAYPGYCFANWTQDGTVVSTETNFNFTVEENAAFVANFIMDTVSFEVSAVANPAEGGTIEGAGTYIRNTTCTLTAIPNGNYFFHNWTNAFGEIVSHDSSISFTVTEDVFYQANFMEEHGIMVTNYDLQSNSALGNRIATWADGTASFVATWDHSGNTSFPDRGTGYNYYDGSSFGDMPDTRIEPVKSGWPSIAACGDGEILASHASGTNVYYRPTKGQGEWILVQNFPNVTWPRIICSGSNDQYVHLVTVYQESVDGVYMNHIYYARSTDSGQTWSDLVEFPNLDNSEYGDYRNQLSADDYVMAANGNDVAVLFGGYTTEVFYMISHDNGLTWERQIVAPFPMEGAHAYVFSDHPNGMDYPVCTSDNSHSITIDDNGVVHVAFALFRWQASNDSNYTYWPAYGYGIIYWNSEYVNEHGGHEIPLFGGFNGDANHYDWAEEGGGLGYSLFPERITELADADGHQHLHLFGYIDEDGDGMTSYYNTNPGWFYRSRGLATMPGISVDEQGNLAIIYSVWSETRICPESSFSYRSAYVTCKDAYGTWFDNAINLSSGSGHANDEVYSTIAAPRGYNGSFWVGYFADESQGLYLDDQNDYVLTENYLYAVKITPDMEGWGDIKYLVSATTNPTGSGYTYGSGRYIPGSLCTLRAGAYPGYYFTNWTKNGTVVSTEANYSFTVEEDVAFVANFMLDTVSFEVTAVANPAEGGIIDGTGTYIRNTSCTLSAIANEGYFFYNWTNAEGEIITFEPSFSFVVTEDISYQANFIERSDGELDYTTYDWQSNKGARTWTHVWPDGKVSFAYTHAFDPSFSDRGTAIGTYDPSTDTWIPGGGRVEDERTGFGTIAQYGANGIVVASHTGSDTRVYIIANKDNIEPNSVSATSILDNTYDISWPNVMTSGPNHNIIHVIATAYDYTSIPGMENVYQPILYFRSQDGGQTWDKQNVVLPFMTAEYGLSWGSNCCYWMETTDDNCLALVVNNPWSDGMVIYSYDNGETWQRKVFYKHPDPFSYYDGALVFPRWTSCQWDSQHRLHVLYEFNATSGDPGSGSFYPGMGGVAYWNEYMPYNMNGTTQSAIPGNLIPGQPFVMDKDYLYNDIYATWWHYSDAQHEMWPEYIGYVPPLTAEGDPEDPYEAWEFNIGDMSSHGSYNSGTCGFPVLCMVPGTDDMVAVWSAMDENHTDIYGYHYYKLFASYSDNGGLEWTPMIQLTKYPIYDNLEFVYNQAAVVGNKLIIASQVDGKTGAYVQGDDDDPYDNRYIGLSFNLDELFEKSYHWDVDIHQYAYNMNAIGIIQINGEEQNNSTLEIGAFCGDECRGRQRAEYIPQLNRYMVFLTLYGEDGDAIDFRLYDHNLNEELDMSCTVSITFATNEILGTPYNPYVFNFIESQNEITQVSDLAAGWNWWSTYVEQEGIDGLEMLEESLGSNGYQIKSQTDFVTNYGFMWMGMLSSINNEETYMIDNTADCQIELTGIPVSPSDHPITVNNGWNWIGYPCTNTMSVGEAFSGYTPANGDQVKSQSDYAMYFSGMWIGQLLSITPGTGLMYMSNNAAPTTLVYPDGNRNTAATASPKATHWKNDIHAYPNNMTVMAVINLDDEELGSDNYELATFDINGECRGSVKLTYVEPINRYVAFLTVSGKEATELNFGLYDSETGREYFNTEKALVYVTNATIGNPDEPYVVRFRSTTGMDELTNSLQVYPNPVNRGERFSINVADEERSPVRVEIVNALGMVVETVCTPSSVQTLTAPNAAGVYTLRITMEGKGTLVRKLVVK